MEGSYEHDKQSDKLTSSIDDFGGKTHMADKLLELGFGDVFAPSNLAEMLARDRSFSSRNSTRASMKSKMTPKNCILLLGKITFSQFAWIQKSQ